MQLIKQLKQLGILSIFFDTSENFVKLKQEKDRGTFEKPSKRIPRADLDRVQ